MEAVTIRLHVLYHSGLVGCRSNLISFRSCITVSDVIAVTSLGIRTKVVITLKLDQSVLRLASAQITGKVFCHPILKVSTALWKFSLASFSSLF